MATDEENKIISWAQFLVICEENDLFSKCQKDEIPRRAVTEKVNSNPQITKIVVRREPTALKSKSYEQTTNFNCDLPTV